MKKTSLFLSIALLCSSFSAFSSEKAPSFDKSSCEQATYPKAALMNEETGTVGVAVVVAPDAKVIDVKIEKSSGSKTLDKATAKMFATCKYTPAHKDGKPEQGTVKVEQVWSLS